MPIITSAEYPLVRAALDIRLTSTQLPDATLALAIFLGEAEREVQTRDPLWDSRTGDDEQRLKNAVCYLTAARLAPRMPELTLSSERFGDYTYQRKATDWQSLADDLVARADAEIAGVLSETPATASMPSELFTVATGGTIADGSRIGGRGA